MRNPVAAGARVVVLDRALQQPQIPPEHVGLPLTWRVGPATRDPTDGTYRKVDVTLRGRGRRPLAPVHLAARWQAGGDIGLSWTRRTRIGGDSWEQAEVPLGEEAEAYALEIMTGDGGAAVRSVVGLSEPQWVYGLAEQTADFGAPVTELSFRVSQISPAFGAGVWASYP